MAWRLPAEWEPQASVWLVWPRDDLTWPDRVEAARDVFEQAMRAIAPQPVDLVVHPDLEAEVHARLHGPDASGLDHVTVHAVDHQDSWIRDYGPLTLVDDQGGRRGCKFRFDAWGRKYASLEPDDDVPRRLAAVDAWPVPFTEVDFVLEGGAVETDGRGTLLATTSVCRGRGQDPEEWEHMVRQHLGARHVVWLSKGIQGDDTDGHIDTLARFVAPHRVVVSAAPEGHPDHAVLADALERLQAARDADGHRLEVLLLPVPPVRTTDDGTPLPAGYANFLITDHAVLVPTYGCPEDEVALTVLARCFPRRRIVGLDHRDLIWGMGGIHCLSMQVPAAQAPAADRT